MSQEIGPEDRFKLEVDRVLDVYLAKVNEVLDHEVALSKMRAALIGKHCVSLFDQVIISATDTHQTPLHAISYSRGTPNHLPRVQLGVNGPHAARCADSKESARQRAEHTTGRFYELSRPAWDTRHPDLIFVSGIEKSDMPNPTVHFMSVDPLSVMYARPTSMLATDVGFLPCPYGNHVWATQRPDMGRVKLPDGICESSELEMTEEGNGLPLLIEAIRVGSQLEAESTFDTLTRKYGMNVMSLTTATTEG